MIVHPQFEEDFHAWLLHIVNGGIAEDPNILLRIRRVFDKQDSDAPADELVTDIVRKTQGLDALMAERRLDKVLCMCVDASDIYHSCKCLAAEKMYLPNSKGTRLVDCIYARGWHFQQWVPAALLPSRRITRCVSQEQAPYPNRNDEQGLYAASRLLSLPWELRHAIWSFAVREDLPPAMQSEALLRVVIVNRSQPYIDSRRRENYQAKTRRPETLLTCRQMHDEMLREYYSENVLSLILGCKADYQAASKWLNNLPRGHWDQISGLVLQGQITRKLKPGHEDTSGRPSQLMRVWIDFTSFTACHQPLDDIDESKEMCVITKSLAQMKQDPDKETPMTPQQFRTLLDKFAKCCVTAEKSTAPPLLMETFDNMRLTKDKQRAFLNSFSDDVSILGSLEA